MVSGENSRGNFDLCLTGIFDAEETAAERMDDVSSLDVTSSGFAFPIKCSTSLWNATLIASSFKACTFSLGGDADGFGATRGRKLSSHTTGRWSEEIAKSDGTKHRATNLICVAGMSTWSSNARE